MSPVAAVVSLLVLCLAQLKDAAVFGRKSNLEGRIVGGSETTIQKFPYMVSIRELSEGQELHLCGASIISENFAVTAGHCCDDENFSANTSWIRAGSTNASEGEKHNLSKIILHPRYHTVVFVPYNDICLLKVSPPFVYSDTIKAVPLPAVNATVPAGATAVVAGWGSTHDFGDTVEQLRQVEVPMVAHSVCASEYGEEVMGRNTIDDTMICAGFQKGGKDTCQGDSGGPLTVNGTQFGIVSWGEGCAEPNFAGVYTNVAYFRDWIKSESGV